MSKKYIKVYVAPEFKKILKTEAAQRGYSIIDLTEEIAREKGKKVGVKINSLFDKII